MDPEVEALANFGEQNIVPEGRDVGNLDSPTWTEFVEARHKGENLSREAIRKLVAAEILSELNSPENSLGNPREIQKSSSFARDVVRGLSRAFIKQPDILDVFRIFQNTVGLGARSRAAVFGLRPDVEKVRLQENTYLRFATTEQVQDLERLYTRLNTIEDSPDAESVRQNINQEIDSVLADVVETRKETRQGAPPQPTTEQTLVAQKTVNDAIDDTALTELPLFRSVDAADLFRDDTEGEIARGTVAEVANALNGGEPYSMPDSMREFVASKSRVSARAREFVRRAQRSGIVPKESKQPILEYLAGMDRASASLTQLIDDTEAVTNIAKYLNKRAPAEVFDSFVAKLAEAGPLMERDLVSSIALIATQLDNARGFAQGMYTQGPVQYGGSSIEEGAFGTMTIYDEGLARFQAENENDLVLGNTKGMLGGFINFAKLLTGSDDLYTAAMYGAAKRIRAGEQELSLLKAIE